MCMELTKFMKNSRFYSFNPFKIPGLFFLCRPAIKIASLKQGISLECLSLPIRARKKKKLKLYVSLISRAEVQLRLFCTNAFYHCFSCTNAIFYHCLFHLALRFLLLHNHNDIHNLQHRSICPGLCDFSVRSFHPSGC